MGPILFVAAWLVGGLLEPGYSPMDDAISRLAAVGASARPLMTAGLAAFAVGMLVFAGALRAALAGPAWTAVVVSGVSTLGVLATPLDVSATVDDLHGIFAIAGYVSLAAVPLLAAATLPRGAGLSVGVGVAAALCLGATAFGNADGLLQRAGLTLLDAWVAGTATWMLRGDHDR